MWYKCVILKHFVCGYFGYICFSNVKPLPDNFCLCILGVSIFSLKEIQLQKDPGFRNSSYPETGVFVINHFTCRS